MHWYVEKIKDDTVSRDSQVCLAFFYLPPLDTVQNKAAALNHQNFDLPQKIFFKAFLLPYQTVEFCHSEQSFDLEHAYFNALLNIIVQVIPHTELPRFGRSFAHLNHKFSLQDWKSLCMHLTLVLKLKIASDLKNLVGRAELQIVVAVVFVFLVVVLRMW